MILELFVVFLFLSFALLTIGLWTKIPLYSFTGLALIFFLSLVMQNGTLQTESGANVTTSGNTTTLTFTYGSYDDSVSSIIGIRAGRLLMLAAGFGFVIAIYDIRKTPKMVD